MIPWLILGAAAALAAYVVISSKGSSAIGWAVLLLALYHILPAVN